MGLVASSRILRADSAPATIDEGEALAIAPGTPVFHLQRVRMLDAVPIALDDALVPTALMPALDGVDFTTASLYELFARAGVDVVRADSTIEAHEADAFVAEHLGVAVGTPMLFLRQVVVDSDDRPLFTSLVRYAGDRYRLRTSFSRSSTR
jgi:DNA-binding GntR family transcriptional regulator